MAGVQQKAPAKPRAQKAMDRAKVELAALTAEKSSTNKDSTNTYRKARGRPPVEKPLTRLSMSI
jgi:hypothetical protein